MIDRYPPPPLQLDQRNQARRHYDEIVSRGSGSTAFPLIVAIAYLFLILTILDAAARAAA